MHIEVRECLLTSSSESFVFQLTIKCMKIKTYRTIILPVVFYGCGSWSLTLKEEECLRVFKNRVLRKILGPRMEKVTGVEKTA